jgi:hypothetical protein
MKLCVLFLAIFSIIAVAQTSVVPVINGLPPGITLNSNGQFNGSPTALGIYIVNVKACDSEVPIQCSPITAITIPVVGSVVINSITMPTGTVGKPYSSQLPISGGLPPYTVTIQP